MNTRTPENVIYEFVLFWYEHIAYIFGITVYLYIICINCKGMLIARKISLVRGLLYIVAQCIGSITGVAILMAVTPINLRGTLGATMVNAQLSNGQALVVEMMITFVLVLTVFGTCDSKRTDLSGSGPLSIGLSVTLCHLAAVCSF